VIFSDGRSEGDPDVLNDLYIRRRGIYEMLSEIIPHLEAIAKLRETPQSVVDFLSSRDKANGLNMKLDLSEKIGMYIAIRNTAIFLEPLIPRPSAPSFAADQQPNEPLPVSDEDFSHQQIVAATLQGQLTRWRAKLKDQLGPYSDSSESN
jgi:hypothetical protein